LGAARLLYRALILFLTRSQFFLVLMGLAGNFAAALNAIILS
jgi:hypothetical protein